MENPVSNSNANFKYQLEMPISKEIYEAWKAFSAGLTPNSHLAATAGRTEAKQ